MDGGTIRLPVARLVMNAQTVTGHLTGIPADIGDTMRFATAHDVRPRLERLPLDQAGLAVRRLRDGQARYRLVLEPRSTLKQPELTTSELVNYGCSHVRRSRIRSLKVHRRSGPSDHREG
ncbi:hypothetical protein HCN51_24575 [Nonomuraea sp. FMUSA5-5]|uniref:Uncharacterized protein n=1 Tax=Nonomuraea composti TaxID=2720023 RepID=A0ABX1B580_9ACTN|nr:hypothetical protein [Nonomuraea sp. FMUSA5-5]NJP92591.1 hypothetical protein [Nonomuraea sp. FMUSA5-5]